MQEQSLLQKLYIMIVVVFSVIVVLSNILSAKMVLLPFDLPAIPAGLIFYPLTFLISDLVTEVFGDKEAKFMVLTALGMSVLSLIMIQATLAFPSPQDDRSLHQVFGISGLRIFASISAYITSQLAGIKIYSYLKTVTAPKSLWQRNSGATLFSQLIDTLMIDLIFFYWGLQMPLENVIPIIAFSYFYKTLFSVVSIPFFYLAVYAIKKIIQSLHPCTNPQ